MKIINLNSLKGRNHITHMLIHILKQIEISKKYIKIRISSISFFYNFELSFKGMYQMIIIYFRHVHNILTNMSQSIKVGLHDFSTIQAFTEDNIDNVFGFDSKKRYDNDR